MLKNDVTIDSDKNNFRDRSMTRWKGYTRIIMLFSVIMPKPHDHTYEPLHEKTNILHLRK